MPEERKAGAAVYHSPPTFDLVRMGRFLCTAARFILAQPASYVADLSAMERSGGGQIFSRKAAKTQGLKTRYERYTEKGCAMHEDHT